MIPETELVILRYIERRWLRLGDSRPPAMWVTHYTPLPDDESCIQHEQAAPLAAWFLDDRGLRLRDPREFQRYFRIHFIQPWCTQEYGEPNAMFNEQRYPIGMASFAELIGSSDVYVQTSYGRRFGSGNRLTVASDGSVSEVNLWRS